jgi:hypothetical protein
MHTGFLNLMERLSSGKLYHCRFCRIQFYDRRDFARAAEEPVTSTGIEVVQAEQTPQSTA